MQNAGLDESQARIKIAGRNINKLRYEDDTNLTAESKEELIKNLLMKVKEEKAVLLYKWPLSAAIMLHEEDTQASLLVRDPLASWFPQSYLSPLSTAFTRGKHLTEISLIMCDGYTTL